VRDGWQQKTLQAICVVDWGNTDLTKQAYTKNGKFLAVSAAGSDGRIGHKEHSAFTPVLSAIGARCGRMFFPEEDFTAIKNTITLTPKRDLVDNKFLYYLLTSVDLPQRGAGQPFISKGDIQKFEVLLPAVAEQQRIVAILDEAFVGLATATDNAEKNVKNARELFDSYLNSVLAEKDQRWTERALGEVCISFGRGRSRHRPRNDASLYGGEFPFIQTGDIRNSQHHIIEYSQTYNKAGLAQSKLWPKGTVCITIAANIAETGILGFDACFPDSVIGAVIDPRKASNKFVEYVLQSFRSRLQAQGKGSAQDNINLGTFDTQKFPFPEIAVQEAIAIRLDYLSAESLRLEATNKAKLAALAELKQSILQKAFTGELTSTSADIINEAAE
jgi:type I restriction enzyme S subunit